MDNLDKNKIIHGTDQKQFDHLVSAMRSNYTEDTAETLYDFYKDKSLSFILKNFYTIASEAYFGSEFVLEIIESNHVPFYEIENLINQMDKIINKLGSIKNQYNQMSLYEQIRNKLLEIKDALENTIKVSNISCMNGGKEILDAMFEYLYDIAKSGSEDEYNKILNTFTYSTDDAYTRATIIAYLILQGGCDVYVIDSMLTSILPPDDTPDKIPESYAEKKRMDIINAVSMIGQDSIIEKSVAFLDFNTRMKLSGMFVNGLQKPKLQYNESADIVGDSAFDTLESIYESSFGDSLENDRNKCNKYDYLVSLRNYYESCRDHAVLIGNDKIVEIFENYIDDISGDLSMMEWTDDGEPDSVIKNHIMTKKQIEKAEQEKEDKKKKAKDEALRKSEEDEDADDDDIEDDDSVSATENKNTRKTVLQTSYKAIRSVKDTKEHVVKSDEQKFINGEQQSLCLGSFKPENISELLKAIKKGISKYDDDFRVVEDNYNTIFLEVRSSSKYYTEAVKTDDEVEEFRDSIKDEKDKKNKSVEKPIKPEEDLPTKIQNKAIDYDVKRQEKRSIRKEKNTKLKNAGKAIAAGPKGWLNSVKKFASDFDKMDVKKRKEFFLKPGYRHKIFRNAKWALLYGGAARYKLTSLPFLMLIRHFSKDKDRRLRNEVIRELDTEISICEEKINDANSNGDQTEKYKLMRIKGKLLAEKNRVSINSNYI